MSKAEFAEGLARRVKYARGVAGMGVRELARASKVSGGEITRIESGERPGMSIYNAINLAIALGIRLEWLALDKGPMKEGGGP